MSTVTLQIALVAVLIVLNAAFAGSEMALISLREGQLRQLERDPGPRAQALLRLAGDPNRYLATIQVGITLAGFLASATAAVSLAQPLVPLLGFLGAAAGPIAVGLVTVVLTYITLVFGELAPKRLAMQFALPWALTAARALDRLSMLSRPVVWLLGSTSNLVVRALGGDPHAAEQQLAPEELRDLVGAHRGLHPEQRTIMTGALEIHERTLRRVLVPRRSVFTLAADLPVSSAIPALVASGHTRAPVIGSADLDDCIGIVNLRELLRGHPTSLAERVTPALVLPDTVRVSEALRLFKAERQQFALVLDEHGGALGIVTLEDVLEEIVGEIYDETDADVIAVRAGPDGELELPGTFPVHDLVDVGVELPDAPAGDYTTLAGLLLVALGRIPERPGDQVQLDGWLLAVTAVDHHAITGVRLTPRPPAAPGSEEGDEAAAD